MNIFSDPNPLKTYFLKNKKRVIHKWMHYFEIYHRHFAPFRNKRITVVEFGVFHGGSLQMWQDYFGKKARIIGVDINPACKQLAGGQIEIYIGDQEDRAFLKRLRKEVGPIDILIEDGGHTMKQQIATFEELFPAVRDGGVYLVEDLHTSYWQEYGGAHKKKGTFIEYAKDLIDQLNAWHSREKSLKVNDHTKSIKGMHVYDSIVVFDKTTVAAPDVQKTGSQTLEAMENY